MNFSKPVAPIVAQMYNFLNLGFEGYRKIAIKDLRNARTLSNALEKTYFKACFFRVPSRTSQTYRQLQVLSNIHKPAERSGTVGKALAKAIADEDDPEHFQRGLPVVSFRFAI